MNGTGAGTDEMIAAVRLAWRHVVPFTVLHVLTRLAVLGLLVPASGLALAAALSLEGAATVTDQDIALFLLSPPGAIAALVVAGILFLAVVLEVALMLVFLRQGERRPVWRALLDVFRVLAGRLVPLFFFGVLLFLRLLLVAAPFALAGAGAALILLGAYDINYYLTYWPREFGITVGLGAGLAVALTAIVLWKLTGWALALHLMLFEGRRPRESFTASAARLERGPRRALLLRIAAWAGLRLAVFAGFAGLAGAAVAGLQEIASPNLRGVVLVTLAGLAAWGLGNAVLSGMCNGALAVLLDRVYGARDPAKAAAPPAAGPAWRLPRMAALALALVAGATGAGLVALSLAPPVAGGARAVEVIAHRGAAAVRPENTMAAIEQALAERADWIEIDVQETADGEVVVAHDSDFMKLAGVDLKVWNATMDDLAAIDIGSWFDPAFSDQRTPTLRAVLEAARGTGRVLIELKYYGHDVALEERVARIVEQTGMEGQVRVMSLDLGGVARMRALRPDWPVGVLAARAIGDLAGLEADFVAVNTGQVSTRLVREVHDAGKRIHVWTVDDPMTMSRMISMGVDGLITNDPALARRVLAQRAALAPAERMILWLSDRFRLRSFELVAEEGDA